MCSNYGMYYGVLKGQVQVPFISYIPYASYHAYICMQHTVFANFCTFCKRNPWGPRPIVFAWIESNKSCKEHYDSWHTGCWLWFNVTFMGDAFFSFGVPPVILSICAISKIVLNRPRKEHTPDPTHHLFMFQKSFHTNLYFGYLGYVGTFLDNCIVWLGYIGYTQHGQPFFFVSLAMHAGLPAGVGCVSISWFPKIPSFQGFGQVFSWMFF